MSAAKKKPKKVAARRGPREASKQRTRDALIRSAMELFAERGLDGPSLDEICAHAGLTRGALYVHFADREALMLAVMDRVGTELLDELFASGDGGFGGAAARFVTASASGRYPLMPKGGIRPYQLLDACARSPELRARYLSLVDSSVSRVAALVRTGQDEGSLRADVPAEAAGTLALALIVGVQTLADLGHPIDLATLAPEVLKLFARRDL
ncbi:MAG: TetR/AcrR family transcriptional regulator [Myxococcales bacterium]|nr:TetR/AcrR family transcriptional regulator [Myxococcales bacterium]